MTNLLAKATSEIGKQAAAQATSIAKDAWNDSRRNHTSLTEEVKRQAFLRFDRVKEESKEIALYLGKHPARAWMLAISGAIFIAVTLMRQSAARSAEAR